MVDQSILKALPTSYVKKDSEGNLSLLPQISIKKHPTNGKLMVINSRQGNSYNYINAKPVADIQPKANSDAVAYAKQYYAKKDATPTVSSGGGGGGGGSSSSGNNLTPEPTLELPKLKLSEGTSVENQLYRLTKKDSKLNRQARTEAREQGIASGRMHSSQQEGAAEAALIKSSLPIAKEEAERQSTEDLSNWQSKTSELVKIYESKYEDYLRDKGYQHEKIIEMTKANTALTQTILNNVGNLLNNPDIEFGQEVMNKLTDIVNTGQDNNNEILKLGLTY